MSGALARLVGQSRGDWELLDGLLARARSRRLSLTEVETLERLYRRAASDLARVQTQHPGSDVERYLLQLNARAVGTLYRPPLNAVSRLKTFYGETFPRTLRARLPVIGMSTLLFVLGLVLGVAVVGLEPAAAERLVPAGVRAAIESGTIWTDDLLSVTPPNVVAGAIATNNLTVTIAAFGAGLLAGLGTVYILLNNGLMIGAVAAACARGGMLPDLLDFISAHGPVELSIICIAGGAGLLLGQALVAPGELPRQEALRLRAREGVTLVLGCAPFLAFIGIIEGYVSPGDFFPTWAKVLLGLTLGAAFWIYGLTAARATARTGRVTDWA